MKKSLTHEKIKATVHEWPTRYEQGFIRSEIVALLQHLQVSERLFWPELGPNTVMVSESGDSITYHVDIKRALNGLLNGKKSRSWVVLNSEGNILTYTIRAGKLLEQWWSLTPTEVDPQRVLDFLFGGHEISDPIKHERRVLNHYNSCRTIRHWELVELGQAILSLQEDQD